ncbi:hypothetical protein FACS1894187_09780 [Synergistales bacterium]|nr:hypothetical protein FACS1894187_09780 [Synergistales bacterium]
MEFVKQGSMSRKEAAETLGLTKRQVRRIFAKYTKEGETGVVHAEKGRKSECALSEELKSEVARLYSEKYNDSNSTHFSELLSEHENIKLSASSVGRILKAVGKESKRTVKRRPKKHKPHERCTQEGMLWQTDATPYAWLGEKVSAFVLHAFIDDATGIVTGAVFTQNEYSRMLQRKFTYPK